MELKYEDSEPQATTGFVCWRWWGQQALVRMKCKTVYGPPWRAALQPHQCIPQLGMHQQEVSHVMVNTVCYGHTHETVGWHWALAAPPGATA